MALAAEDIQQRVVKIFVQELGVDHHEVIPSARVQEDLGCDSLDVVELTMALEDEFGIEIPDESVLKVVTVQDVFDYLGQHVT